MGFAYFGKEKWINISREERLFCAHLYWAIKSRENKFLEWISQRHQCGIRFTSSEIESDWEVGYEVCLYRDYLKNKGESIKSGDYSSKVKRTFDLCLFSKRRIIIIEAKVCELFKKSQVESLEADIIQIPELLETPVRVDAIAIASSKYFKNYEKRHRKDESNLLQAFSCRITWSELEDFYNDSIFRWADSIYGK